MPGVDFTVTNYLVPMIRRTASLAKTNGLLTDEDLIAFANDELQRTVVPLIQKAREEYFVHYIDIPFEAGRSRYTIPVRGIASQLRDVLLTDGNQALYSVPRLDPALMGASDFTGPYNVSTGVLGQGFYLQDNEIIFWPAPVASNATYIRLSYFRRPNDLIENADAAVVTNVNTGTGVITFAARPTGSVVGSELDSIAADSPFVSKINGAVVTAATATTVTVATDTEGLDELEVGDWMALAGTSPIPQIIREAQPLLAQAVSVRALIAKKDKDGAMMAQGLLAQQRAELLEQLSPRVEGEPKKMVNPYSLFRRSGRFGQRGF